MFLCNSSMKKYFLLFFYTSLFAAHVPLNRIENQLTLPKNYAYFLGAVGTVSVIVYLYYLYNYNKSINQQKKDSVPKEKDKKDASVEEGLSFQSENEQSAIKLDVLQSELTSDDQRENQLFHQHNNELNELKDIPVKNDEKNDTLYNIETASRQGDGIQPELLKSDQDVNNSSIVIDNIRSEKEAFINFEKPNEPIFPIDVLGESDNLNVDNTYTNLSFTAGEFGGKSSGDHEPRCIAKLFEQGAQIPTDKLFESNEPQTYQNIESCDEEVDEYRNSEYDIKNRNLQDNTIQSDPNENKSDQQAAKRRKSGRSSLSLDEKNTVVQDLKRRCFTFSYDQLKRFMRRKEFKNSIKKLDQEEGKKLIEDLKKTAIEKSISEFKNVSFYTLSDKELENFLFNFQDMICKECDFKTHKTKDLIHICLVQYFHYIDRSKYNCQMFSLDKTIIEQLSEDEKKLLSVFVKHDEKKVLFLEEALKKAFIAYCQVLCDFVLNNKNLFLEEEKSGIEHIDKWAYCIRLVYTYPDFLLETLQEGDIHDIREAIKVKMKVYYNQLILIDFRREKMWFGFIVGPFEICEKKCAEAIAFYTSSKKGDIKVGTSSDLEHAIDCFFAHEYLFTDQKDFIFQMQEKLITAIFNYLYMELRINPDECDKLNLLYKLNEKKYAAYENVLKNRHNKNVWPLLEKYAVKDRLEKSWKNAYNKDFVNRITFKQEEDIKTYLRFIFNEPDFLIENNLFKREDLKVVQTYALANYFFYLNERQLDNGMLACPIEAIDQLTEEDKRLLPKTDIINEAQLNLGLKAYHDAIIQMDKAAREYNLNDSGSIQSNYELRKCVLVGFVYDLFIKNKNATAELDQQNIKNVVDTNIQEIIIKKMKEYFKTECLYVNLLDKNSIKNPELYLALNPYFLHYTFVSSALEITKEALEGKSVYELMRYVDLLDDKSFNNPTQRSDIAKPLQQTNKVGANLPSEDGKSDKERVYNNIVDYMFVKVKQYLIGKGHKIEDDQDVFDLIKNKNIPVQWDRFFTLHSHFMNRMRDVARKKRVNNTWKAFYTTLCPLSNVNTDMHIKNALQWYELYMDDVVKLNHESLLKTAGSGKKNNANQNQVIYKKKKRGALDYALMNTLLYFQYKRVQNGDLRCVIAMNSDLSEKESNFLHTAYGAKTIAQTKNEFFRFFRQELESEIDKVMKNDFVITNDLQMYTLISLAYINISFVTFKYEKRVKIQACLLDKIWNFLKKHSVAGKFLKNVSAENKVKSLASLALSLKKEDKYNDLASKLCYFININRDFEWVYSFLQKEPALVEADQLKKAMFILFSVGSDHKNIKDLEGLCINLVGKNVPYNFDIFSNDQVKKTVLLADRSCLWQMRFEKSKQYISQDALGLYKQYPVEINELYKIKQELEYIYYTFEQCQHENDYLAKIKNAFANVIFFFFNEKFKKIVEETDYFDLLVESIKTFSLTIEEFAFLTLDVKDKTWNNFLNTLVVESLLKYKEYIYKANSSLIDMIKPSQQGNQIQPELLSAGGKSDTESANQNESSSNDDEFWRLVKKFFIYQAGKLQSEELQLNIIKYINDQLHAPLTKEPIQWKDFSTDAFGYKDPKKAKTVFFPALKLLRVTSRSVEGCPANKRLKKNSTLHRDGLYDYVTGIHNIRFSGKLIL